MSNSNKAQGAPKTSSDDRQHQQQQAAAAAAEAAKAKADADAKAKADAEAKAEADAKARAEAEKAAADAKAQADAAAKAKADADKAAADVKSKIDADHDKDDNKSQQSKTARGDGDKDDQHDRSQGDDRSDKHVKADPDAKDSGDKHAEAKADGDKDKGKSHDDDKAHGDHGDKSASGGDGDKDDRGHHVTPPTPPAPPVPVESLVLKAADVANVGTGSSLLGTKTADALQATTGHDQVFGRGGNDIIHGADAAPVTLPLAIDGSLVNAANADAVSFLISGMPQGASLSAGHDNGNGTWSLTKADLSGLAVTAGTGADFTLHVAASATDGSGLTQNSDLHVTMHAGQGNLLSGGSGNDTIYGSANGDDVIYGGSVPTGTHTTGHAPTASDNDTIFVGNGNAHVFGQSGDDTIWAGAGRDAISGGSGNDVLHAGSGTGEIDGNGGNDHIFAGTGNYVINGGAGFDTLDFSGAANGISVDLKAKTATGAGDLTVKGIEAVIGSSHDDVIFGDAGANVFTGGGGSDTFGFRESDLKLGNVDHVTDFGAGDRLDLSGVLHGKSQNFAVTDGQNGTTVSVKVGGAMHDLVVLDGVHGMTAHDMLAHGMILN